MITGELQIRPRYGEVDQMGYVYHANYVSYCHQARTELLRKYGINDSVLEENNVILPVISFSIKYLKPAFYDEPLTIKTTVHEFPEVRFNFEFEIFNQENIKVSTAKSTIVFADSTSRFPMGVPDFVEKSLRKFFKPILL
ncbi:MAG: acyl-CoA thioesterase [Bacteroidales bacterium]|nr:acyl-CoA thioesterase [Bacteroidales bacterium]